MTNYHKSRSFQFLVQLVVKRRARYLPPALNIFLVYLDYNNFSGESMKVGILIRIKNRL